jgi:hypothetical protein
VRQFLGILLGMLGAVLLWQGIAAFLGVAIFFNGMQAGFSLLAFGVTLIVFGVLIRPKRNDY